MSLRSFALSLVALLLAVSGQAALAQTTAATQPPPDSLAVSPYGVDMVTGIYRDEATDLVIGDPDNGGIAYRRASALEDNFLRRRSNWYFRIQVKVRKSNPEANVSLFSMGVSKTWISYDSGAPPYYEIGARTEGVSLLTKNAAGEFVYTAPDASVITFNAPGSDGLSYARKITRPDGIEYTLTYGNGSSPGAGLKVASSTGYMLIEEANGLKACVLNLTTTTAPAGFVCPASATSVTYTSTGALDWTSTNAMGGQTVRSFARLW